MIVLLMMMIVIVRKMMLLVVIEDCSTDYVDGGDCDDCASGDDDLNDKWL